jgi:hypothetical protein
MVCGLREPQGLADCLVEILRCAQDDNGSGVAEMKEKRNV